MVGQQRHDRRGGYGGGVDDDLDLGDGVPDDAESEDGPGSAAGSPHDAGHAVEGERRPSRLVAPAVAGSASPPIPPLPVEGGPRRVSIVTLLDHIL